MTAPAARTDRAVSWIMSRPSTEHGPAITATARPPTEAAGTPSVRPIRTTVRSREDVAARVTSGCADMTQRLWEPKVPTTGALQFARQKQKGPRFTRGPGRYARVESPTTSYAHAVRPRRPGRQTKNTRRRTWRGAYAGRIHDSLRSAQERVRDRLLPA